MRDSFESAEKKPVIRQASRQFPLTPPASTKKETSNNGLKSTVVVPKSLLPNLKFESRKRRKPPLRRRPPKNSIYELRTGFPRVSDKRDNKLISDCVTHALQESQRIVVVAGAGISVAAGIPDFRSNDGLFATLRDGKLASGKDLFDFNKVYSDEEIGLKFNKMIIQLYHQSTECQPTEFHHLMDRIAGEGRLRRLYTQNIDALEHKLPSLSPMSQKNAPVTIQLHGNVREMFCVKCSKIYDLNSAIFKCNVTEESKDMVPSCPECQEFESVRAVAGLRSQGVGKLRPRVVLYNEVHPDGDAIGAIISKDLKTSPDCLLIVGTSFKIPGVRTLCRDFARVVHKKKGFVVWINKEIPSKRDQEYLDFIDVIIVGDCQDVCHFMKRSC
ncbi:LAMI_0H18668g1_1 [Lachancea mirantina]|uniref:LAMI_0H18668g1_1 n=1 Tax=Lachancea mirantina TaxID=1230905 RepID=A0A1G4KJT9_9SACH|nr:LAMI_0H18668g1_1 [Lachancea mirantina]